MPTYNVIVSGVDDDGIQRDIAFEAIRFGVEENANEGITPHVVGRSRAQTHTMRWNYITTMNAMAWRVTGRWFIHEGPKDPLNSRMGFDGCIGICGLGQ